MNKEFKKLSGGEMQLASLLRAMVVNPDLIFYDEPTNNLDGNHFDMIISILDDLISEDKKLITVSHDKRIFKNLQHKSIYLEDMRTIYYE
jgi:ABC-type lipoprotein export system ATPase subunit